MSDKAKIRRPLRCHQCGSLDNIKWGIRNEIQRYKCDECGHLFSARRKDITKSNRFVWFQKWVSGRMTMDEIAGRSGAPARKHHHLYLPYQIPFPAACRAISSLSKSATYVSSMSIGRVYVQPEAKIAVSDFTVKGPQNFILMDRSWGFPINVLLQGGHPG